MVALIQHSPEGGSGVEQHTPMLSTTTPSPLQIPQASITPEGQHCPTLSVMMAPWVKELPQQSSVSTSIGPLQQVPAASTTQPLAPASALVASSDTMSHCTPVHPSAQAHTPLEHTLLGEPQSEAVVHPHRPSTLPWVNTKQDCDDGGCRCDDDPSTHAAASTSAPVAADTHRTVRVMLPANTQLTEGTAELVVDTQPLQGPSSHITTAAGHTKRLQGRVVTGTGRGSPTTVHACASVRTTVPFARVDLHVTDALMEDTPSVEAIAEPSADN
jgi:hypothetical protein